MMLLDVPIDMTAVTRASSINITTEVNTSEEAAAAQQALIFILLDDSNGEAGLMLMNGINTAAIHSVVSELSDRASRLLDELSGSPIAGIAVGLHPERDSVIQILITMNDGSSSKTEVTYA